MSSCIRARRAGRAMRTEAITRLNVTRRYVTLGSRAARVVCPRVVGLLICVAHHDASAQARAQSSTPGDGAFGEVRGHLVSVSTLRPVTSGAITLKHAGADSSFAGGALPNADGTFHIEGLKVGEYSLRFRGLGFEPIVRGNITISVEHPVVELGALPLTPSVAVLGARVVTAQREEVALAPDRTTYSVKNMTTASGGTAVDVLRNIPAVEVDAANKVTLRGSENVVVQINGRSSPLHGDQLGIFLAQLPANGLARVEIATNPSAKNDPDGTAGIINIVLSQQTDPSWSSNVSAASGSTGMLNVSSSIGRQYQRATLFAAIGVNRDRRDLGGYAYRTNLALPTPASVEASSSGTAEPVSLNLTLRSEYHVARIDIVSADAMFSGGRFARDNAARYVDRDRDGVAIGLAELSSDQHATNRLGDYTLGYRHDGGDTATTVAIELRYTNVSTHNANELASALLQGIEFQTANPSSPEQDITDGKLPSWNIKSDYTRRIGATKLEAGAKVLSQETLNDFGLRGLDSASGVFVPTANGTISLLYRQYTGALYSVLSLQPGRFQLQSGLRLEQAVTDLEVRSSNQQYDNRYRSFFPSAAVVYDATQQLRIKASYSRRVSRPSLVQLTPIAYFEDKRNAFRGNPTLRPEYADAFEVSATSAQPWGSVQVTPYLRRTKDAIRYLQIVDSTGTSLGTYANVASLLTIGADGNATYRRGAVTLLAGGGVNRLRSDATNLPGDLSVAALTWVARANVTWQANPRLDVQLLTNYRARYQTEGGSQDALVLINLALRRMLWNDKGSISLRATDPLNMLASGYQTSDARVIEVNHRTYGMRALVLTVTRSFGEAIKLRAKGPDADAQGASQPGPL
jgi:Outer membrane receptor proteins, mostly Fe transport